ncbi:hypothetical protein KBTX_04539 [wastewater metagenome]|uniref:Uncharacterized protein n=3 Tax=root TaxID=1 RepID=A0A5B8RGY7_9ZZZZ|nr:hypothetical protein KBTEX_04539 [uncultured organism]
MHIFFDDGDVDLENESRGNLSGTYEGTANLFALSADYRF